MTLLIGRTILVVDDEQDLREILCEELSAFGAKVSMAPSGRVALDLLESDKFDVLISDVRMADGDGITLLTQLKDKVAVKPKIFLCSGYNDITKESARGLGVIEIFSKPFQIDKMVRTIADSLI